jgi:hypothetical protein
MPLLLTPHPAAPVLDDLDWPVLPPTLLTVHRTSPADEGSRQIVCRLDDEPLVELLYGQSHTREILPGPHTLRVHNTLVRRSVTFEAPPGGHVHYTVANRAGRGYYVLVFLIGVAPLSLSLEPGRPA